MLQLIKLDMIFFTLLISHVFTSRFDFKRQIYCVLQTAKGCVHWESSIFFQKQSDPACFPQETYLQGTTQKIKISELKIGDQILVYNKDKGISYEPIVAWLHRSTQQTFSYTSIHYQSENHQNPIQNRIFISGMHNIAVLDSKENKLEFIFTQKLEIGNNLYGLGPYKKSDAPQVVDITKQHIQKGIYAPYTKSGNYFITGNINSQQLILVHCFAHVSPNYHSAFDIFLQATSFIFDVTSQPSNEQIYINPLARLFQNLFPSVLQISEVEQRNDERIKQLHKSEFRTAGDKTVQLDPLHTQRGAFLIIDLLVSPPWLLP